MKTVVGPWLVGGVLCGLIGCSSAEGDACPPDLTNYVSLETRARPDDPLGITAQSTLQYLARESLPTTGFYLSRKPLKTEGATVEYELVHESGFDKACTTGNKSGYDGILEIDSSTREVKSFRRSP